MSESFEKAVKATTLAMMGRPTLSATTVSAALRAALPHLTADDVPHLIRRAKAEAWEVGRSMGLSDHSASMRAGRPLRTPNPYAEEATNDHHA